jgi:hypothetical protein
LQRSQHSDPLTQLPMFVLRSCSAPLQCTVLEESAPDPLTQLPSFVVRSLQRFLCGALCFGGQPPDPLTQLPCCCTLVAALAAVHCVTEVSTPDPLTQLPLLCARLLQSHCVTEFSTLILWTQLLHVVVRFLQLLAVHCVTEVSTLILSQLPCLLRSLQRSFGAQCLRRVSLLILWHSCPCSVRFLQRSFAVHGVLQEVSTLILWHSCHVVVRSLQRPLQCTVLRVSPDPLTQLPMLCYALAAPLQCTVLQSTSDPLTQPSFVLRSFAALLCSALCCRESALLILWHSCLVALRFLQRCLLVHCAEVSIPDPLTQLPVLFCARSLFCSALCCRGQHSDPLTRFHARPC